MNDLISRSEVIDILCNLHIDNVAVNDKRVTEYIKELPTVEAKPVVHGEWITHYTSLGKYYECQICGNTANCKKNFYSSCGCDMRGGKNE